MTRITIYGLLAFSFLLLLAGSSAPADSKTEHLKDRDPFFRPAVIMPPYSQTCTHRSNRMYLTVSNFGMIGSMNQSYRDCETGKAAPSCEFPGESQLDYLYGAGLWIGAIVGTDTLVSTGWDGWEYLWEMWPCAEPECGFTKRSSSPTSEYYSEEAVSDFEYVATFTDTLADQQWNGIGEDHMPHKPLDLEIEQTTYSWSVGYAEDFILIDYLFRNIGEKDLDQVYIGILVDADVSHISRQRGAWTDDICGFIETAPSIRCPEYLDSINLAWVADNDGEVNTDQYIFDEYSANGVTGASIMRTPKENLKVSFNWWTSNGNAAFDWGPMLASHARNFGTGGLGTPVGDAARYYLMSNGERDYDQTRAEQNLSDLGWLPPTSTASTVARGGDARYLLSTGPFDIDQSDSLHFTLAYVAGEDLHVDPEGFNRYMKNTYDPDGFYDNLDFSDLIENAVWAGWIYDNPGVDTDGDGNSGSFCVNERITPAGNTVLDTIYVRGDGVPDFRAAVPPPPPVLRQSTTLNTIHLKWNGLETEQFVDPFTQQRDFEGYKVYAGRFRTLTELARLVSVDKMDFFRYMWNDSTQSWELADYQPLLLDSLQRLYGDTFDPADYPCYDDGSGGYAMADGRFCFEASGWNQSIRGWRNGADDPSNNAGIKKVYADDIERGDLIPFTDTLDPDDGNVWTDTLEKYWILEYDKQSGDSVRFHKYYEYEYTINNVLESVPWFVSVTAVDYGDAIHNLDQLESSPLANAIEVWPVNNARTVVNNNLKVTPYPNPYIGNGRYWVDRYEDFGRSGFVDHERRIHFANLPPKCRISIYTLDGDLVRRIDHPGRFTRADSKLEWDMRSRNNELVASGIYLFVVESDLGNQIGKIVIIR